MMSKDYSGLSPRAALGGANLSLDGSGEVVIGSLWTSDQIFSIDQTFTSLKESGIADNDSIDRSVQNLRLGLHHPTWQANASDCVEAIYNLSPLEGQIRAIVQLLSHDDAGHNFVDLISKLLFEDDGGLLGKLLGSEGIQRLLQIAAQSNPKTQTGSLVTWAKSSVAIAPKTEEDKGYLENQIQDSSSGDGPRYVGPIIIDATLAASMNNVDALESLVQNLSANQVALQPFELAEALVDRLGEDSRSILQELAINSSDPTVRDFAVSGLMYLAQGDSNPPTQDSSPITGGTGLGSNHDNQPDHRNSAVEVTNLHDLETILNTPGIIPSTLAARIGFSPSIHAQLLQLIVNKK